MRVITIILGALLLIGGIYCMFAPIATYSALGWLIGFAMIVEGIGSVIVWNDRRRLGLADGWTLAGAILSIVLGVFLLGSFAAQFALDLFIAYLIAIWLVFGGIARIAAALSIRKYQKETMGADAPSSGWIGLLVIGILIIILGILCIFNPTSIMISVGLLLGLSIVCTGAGLIANGARRR